jgi:hypothetical protein
MGLLTVFTIAAAAGIYMYSSLNSLPEDTEESAIVRDYQWAYVPEPMTGQAPGSCSPCKCGQEFMGPGSQMQCEKCLEKKAKRK